MAITALPIDIQLDRIVDFTQPFQEEKISMLIKRRTYFIDDVANIFKPFTPGLWFASFGNVSLTSKASIT